MIDCHSLNIKPCYFCLRGISTNYSQCWTNHYFRILDIVKDKRRMIVILLDLLEGFEKDYYLDDNSILSPITRLRSLTAAAKYLDDSLGEYIETYTLLS